MTTLLTGLVVGFVVAQVGLYITTIYLHRALTHKALTIRPTLSFVFRVLTWMITGIRPRQWVAVHRKHHAFTDTPQDPHSPLIYGYAKVQFGNVVLYRRSAKDPDVVAKYAKDLPRDRWDRVLFDHALVGLALGIGLLVLVFGWQIALVASVVHTALYLLGGGAINAIGHKWGKRPYDNLATNNQWLAWLVAGEGLHNNHHAQATSGKLSLNKGEFDPAWGLISILRVLKQVSLREMKFSQKVSSHTPS